MMYKDDIKKVDEWFEEHTEFYGTYHEGDDYSISHHDIEDFTKFLWREFPGLIGIRCYIGTGDGNIWFFGEDLEQADFL